MRRPYILIALLCLLIPAFAVQAQAPDAINAALKDLSQRVGRTVTINDLNPWSFEQKIFSDTSLGCPQPGVAYTQEQIFGDQFLMTYNGVAYDYRVSGDQTIVILCTSAGATPVPAPCPPPNDTAFLAPRLSIGMMARVEEGGVPNNIRDVPGSSGKLLGEIPPGQAFTVTDGPRCSLIDKIVWWQVNFNGITGWTAEGKSGDYWVEPLTLVGTQTPIGTPGKTPITTTNAALIAPVPGAILSDVSAVSPNGDRFAQVVATAQQHDVRVQATGSNSLLSFPWESDFTSLAFDSTGNLLVIGLGNGQVLLVTITDTQIQLRLQMSGHTGAVNAVAMSPDGKVIASAGADNTLRLWDATSGASLATLTGDKNPIVSVVFSPDGATLITKDNQGVTYLWRVSTAAAG